MKIQGQFTSTSCTSFNPEQSMLSVRTCQRDGGNPRAVPELSKWKRSCPFGVVAMEGQGKFRHEPSITFREL